MQRLRWMRIRVVLNRDHRSLREFAALQRRAELLSRSVVPLFVDRPSQRPKALGSGFLMNRGGEAFLISAGHVLDEAMTTDTFFYAGNKKIHRLYGSMRSTPTADPGKRRDDSLDVGVLRFAEAQLGHLAEIDKIALDFRMLKSDAPNRLRSKYLLTGFPGSKSGFHARNRQLESLLLSHLFSTSPIWRYNEFELSPRNHIVIPYDSSLSSTGINGSGNLPAPEGLSGSPVWKHGSLFAKFATVAGILIAKKNFGKNLVATDVRYVIDIVENAFKDGARIDYFSPR